ncbi:MAG: hypothetical protein ACYC7I_04150 [Gammaproteobacteria bacterium]
MSDAAPEKGFIGKYRLLLLGGAALGILLLGGLIILRPHATCDGIFEQTAPHLEANLEIIRSKGALAVGQEKIQELTESAQKVGLHLKTCCAVLSGGKLNPSQFQQCIDGAAGYDRQVAHVAEQVTAVTQAQKSGIEGVAPAQRAEIVTAISAATQGAEDLGRHVAQLQPASTATPAPAGATTSGHETEPNDTPANANTIKLGDTIEAEIKPGDDLDYYKVTASKAQRDLVRVSLENLSTTLGPKFTLYNQNKSQIGYDHYDGTPGADLDFVFALEVGTSNYIRVASSSGNATGAYRLRVAYQNAGDSYEPNDSAAQATAIRAGQIISANIMDGQDQDWYRFQAGAANVRVRMDVDSQTLAPQLNIYDENRSQVANPYNGTHGASLDYTLTTTPGKTYYIAVVPYGDTSVPGNYRLTIADQAAPAH